MNKNGGNHPLPGNYVGGTYTVTDLLANCEREEHEGRASDLVALDGKILLDYLRVTVRDCPAVRATVREFLGAWHDRGRGWRGWYDQSWDVLDGGIIAACSDPERAKVQGLLVDLPGRACACLGDDLPVFFLWATEHGHICRADYAIDDRAGRLTRERVLDAERSGGLVSRWQGFRHITDHRGGDLCGWTFYLGSRDGDAMVRIYDKAGQLGVPGPLVRFELETKGKLAGALAVAYHDVGSQAVIGQINRRLRFALPDSLDGNKRRWPISSWWAEFLGNVQPGPALCAGRKLPPTIETMREVVMRQAGPSIAAVVAADGNSSWLTEVVSQGTERMQSKHHAAVAAVQEVRRIAGSGGGRGFWQRRRRMVRVIG